MANITEVAEAAGVSISTVSYALSGKRPVAADTRRRIEAAVRELGYSPNAGARMLAGSRTQIFALTEPLRAQVATVAVAGTQVTLGLVDDRSVRWGDPERSADKIAVLGPLLGQPGSVYDVSSPDLPTVRP